MKKIILWLLLLTAYALPQNPVFNAGDYSIGRRMYRVTLDTLGTTTTDTISTHWFNSSTTDKFNQFMDGFITVHDSAGITDTFYVQRHDTLDPYKTYTTSQMIYIDMSTTYPTSTITGQYGLSGGFVLIPGNGLEKSYYVSEPYPRQYRVWVSKYAVRTGRTIFVKWTDRMR